MLRLIGRFLIHCRWPLIVALATLLILVYTLQPRPLAEYRLTDKAFLRFSNQVECMISPSGTYLVVFSDHYHFHLYRLNNMELVFKQSCTDRTACGFDVEDGLAFASYSEKEDDSIVECWHWHPGQSSPQKLGSRKAFPTGIRSSGSWYGDRFNGMRDSRGHISNCLLSPDTKTWLLPSHNERTFHFDVVDSRTGQVRARLERPDISTGTSSTNGLQFAFIADSSKLLAQADLRDPDRYPEEKHALECFDTQTGKQLSIGKLPEDAKLGLLCQWDNDNMVGLDVNKNMLTMQWLTKDKGYRLAPLPETMPVPAETTWGKESDSLWVAQIESFSFHFHSGKEQVVYCWEHVLYPKHGGMSGIPPYLHGFHYAVRDLNTGNLLHTEKLTHPQEKDDNMRRAGWNLIGILPDHALLFQQPYVELQPWQEKLESWRDQYVNWLPKFFRRDDARLQLIDAATGQRLTKVSFPLGNNATFYHKQQNALYISGHNDEDFIIQKYAYPLRKPWPLILTWTLAAFAVLASLQGLLHLIRRRRS